MKAYSILLKKYSKDIHGNDLMEAVILNTPPGGSTTDQIIKGGILYNEFDASRKKNEGIEEWLLWLDKDKYNTLQAQVETMRWNANTPEVRRGVMAFVAAIKEAKEEEVPGT